MILFSSIRALHDVVSALGFFNLGLVAFCISKIVKIICYRKVIKTSFCVADKI